jgi:hypothetical protein
MNCPTDWLKKEDEPTNGRVRPEMSHGAVAANFDSHCSRPDFGDGVLPPFIVFAYFVDSVEPFSHLPYDFVNLMRGQGSVFSFQFATPSGHDPVLAGLFRLVIGFGCDLPYRCFPRFEIHRSILVKFVR